MTGTPVSLIVVSRHRTASLLRSIAAARLQDHLVLELIVVADPKAAMAVRALGLPIKVVAFDQANIAAARNAGLAMAAGDIVAFLDDDAVPEPTWISRLTAPFANQTVRMATGFVRGRNGISDQWRACDVDQFGWDHPLAVDRNSVTLLAGTSLRAVKAQGTNCAFRRADLQALGGFDEGFRFYLDDADISLRLAALGGLTAVVPDAVVQHGFAGSVRRRADRAPLSLHDIGASAAYFLRRHARDADVALQLRAHRDAQNARLIRQMVQGGLEPRDINTLLASFDQGWAEGLLRAFDRLTYRQDKAQEFLSFGTMRRAGILISGRVWARRNLARRAGVEAALGKIVTVVCLSPTTWYHQHRFESGGFWMQRGGIFGRSLRDQAVLRRTGFAGRLGEEVARISKTRPIN